LPEASKKGDTDEDPYQMWHKRALKYHPRRKENEN
jgi:hypothetical protein